MAQTGKAKKKNTAPAYSADTMALRFIFGLTLIALGAMIFLAVVIRMSGPVFEGLRRICYGLTGAFALVLAALPVWAGVLVILSTQRRAPVRPFVWALCAFLSFCAFILLVTRVKVPGSPLLLEYMSDGNRAVYGNPDDWAANIAAAYEYCGANKGSSGAVGTMFAWPLWKFTGSFLTGVIYFLLTAFCILMAVGLTPKKLIALLKGEKIRLIDGRQRQRSQQEEQQIAWQQEQQRREEEKRQAFLQQQYAQQQYAQQQYAQQQYAGQQYAQQQYPQQPYSQGQNAQEMQPGAARQFDTVQQQAYEQNYRRPENTAQGESVRQWQSDIETEAAAKGRKGRHSSKLFNTGRQAAVQDDTSRMGVFTGRQYDGLTTAPAASERKKRPYEKTADARNAGQAVPPARTSFSMPVQGGGYSAQTPAAAEPVYAPAAEPARGVSDVPDRYTAPERASYRGENAEPARADDRGVKNETAGQAAREPAREPVDEPAVREPEKPVRGSVPETAAGAVPEAPAEKESVSAPASRRDRKREPEQLAVPVVQSIGENAWKPELKLPPRRDVPEAEAEDNVWMPTEYHYPRITNLKMPEENHENTQEEDMFRSRRLEETLASFHVQAHVVHVTHGPAISRFELELAPGTKVNKVTELGKDIAYGMEATSVRIEAPIPGKSLVGVEVPNRKVSTVTLREVLQDDRMQNAKSILTVALGKDIAGTPIVCDLAKMPHMLIAGATGSGKSVCINAIINSLLYRAGPDEVKMILVDPKVVELQCYNGIPHLLIPVVNDPHKAAAALAWAVAEMMDRYDKFAARRVRSLDSYNEALGPGEKPMPRIVIIIDELADLMMVCKKDVEEYICRLTQLARAAGIHLIVATQRPSVDVITGLIKANIPSRIAFKTASSVDSRTILDRNGSESLLGNGDMLYLPTGAFAPTRIQGCFLSDGEVNRIASDVRDNNPSTYDPNILEKLEEMTQEKIDPAPDVLTGAAETTDSDRDLFEKSVEMAIADGQISTSTLQRRLKIGYSRAGRLTDELEERGIISQKDGSKPRKCLVTREQWEAIKKDTEA